MKKQEVMQTPSRLNTTITEGQYIDDYGNLFIVKDNKLVQLSQVKPIKW